jgi:hypothetical protein
VAHGHDDSALRARLRTPRQTFGESADPVFTSSVTVLTHELADAAAEYPAGQVDIRAWFEPVVDRGA